MVPYSKFLVAIVWVVLAAGATAQVNPTNYMRTDLIGKAPNTSSIGKAGEVPVNLSTGSPNVSIPLFTVQGNELSLPITLSYSYDGFKPAQPISWIGLGWSMQAGGVITRTVRDKVDEIGAAEGSFDTVTSITTRVNDYDFMNDAMNYALIDLEPDLYSFNFAGYSGKFVLYKGKAYPLPYQKLKISGSPSTSFTITTPEGTKYIFTEMEFTSPKGSPGAPYNIPSNTPMSWYLSRVENAAGTEAIQLTYADEGMIEQSGTLTQTYQYVHPLQGSNYGTGADARSSYLFPKKGTYPTYAHSLRLESISSEKYTVTFTPVSTARKDLVHYSGGSIRALGSVSISATGTGTIKTFVLDHGYFGDSTYASKSFLKFKALKQYDSGSTLQETHTFDYVNESSGTWPHRTLAIVDNGGYYKNTGEFSDVIVPQEFYPSGPDRSPSTSADYGALAKITWPTGGYTTLTYANHTTANSLGYQKEGHWFTSSVSGFTTNPNVIASDTTGKIFYLDHAQTITVNLERTVPSPFMDNNARNASPDFIILNLHDEDAIDQVYSGQINAESDNSGKLFSIPLSAGYYYVVTYIDHRESAMSAEVSYLATTDTPSPGTTAPGLCISDITSYPLVGLPVKRTFRYVDALGFCSGVDLPFSYDVKDFTEYIVTSLNLYEVVTTNYTTAISETFGMTVPHYYASVFEETSTGTQKLRTRHEFVSYQTEGSFLGIEPTVVTQYKQSGASFVPIKKISYGKTTYVDTTIMGIKAYTATKVTISSGFSALVPETWNYTPIPFASMWLYDTGTRDVTYENGDSIVVETLNDYDVAGSRNLKHTFRTGSDGKSYTTRYKYAEDYTGTYSSAFKTAYVLSPPWEEQVWRKNSGSDSVLVSGKITFWNSSSFKPDSIYALETAAGLAALDNQSTSSGKFSTLISDSRYKPRVSYAYDAAGRLVTQQLTKGSPVSYKWGYAADLVGSSDVGQMNFVIAEAKNAAPTEFYVENFEEHGSAATGDAHTGDKYKSGDFSVTWSVPNGRSYVISYWYLDGSTWKFKGEQAYTGSTTLSDGDAIDDVCIFPKDAQVSLYTLYPGIGLRTATDTRGKTTYYDYDNFSRLVTIRDQDGNPVKTFTYHYQ